MDSFFTKPAEVAFDHAAGEPRETKSLQIWRLNDVIGEKWCLKLDGFGELSKQATTGLFGKLELASPTAGTASVEVSDGEHKDCTLPIVVPKAPDETPATLWVSWSSSQNVQPGTYAGRVIAQKAKETKPQGTPVVEAIDGPFFVADVRVTIKPTATPQPAVSGPLVDTVLTVKPSGEVNITRNILDAAGTETLQIWLQKDSLKDKPFHFCLRGFGTPTAASVTGPYGVLALTAPGSQKVSEDLLSKNPDCLAVPRIPEVAIITPLTLWVSWTSNGTPALGNYAGQIVAIAEDGKEYLVANVRLVIQPAPQPSPTPKAS